MEYCCHVWAGAPDCSLELLDKLHAASLEPLAHFRNVASLSLFYRFTLVDVLQNWLNCFHFLFLKGGLLAILIDCMIFLSPIVDVTWMSMPTVSFLTQLDSGILCLYNAFLWTMTLVALHLELTDTFNCRFFLNRFPICCNPFVLLFLVTPCPVVAVQLCMEWITIKKKNHHHQHCWTRM